MSLRFHFLGVARFEYNGHPVDISSGKAVALLAYLSIAPAAQTRGRIQSLLWPESTDEAARKNLRNVLWSVRRALGDDVISTEGDRVRLTAGVWCDVRELLTNTDTPELINPPLITWQASPFLDSLSLDDAPEYEIWLATTREQVGQAYLHAVATLATQYQTQGAWEKVLDATQLALAFDNLQEPMYRLAMIAHAQVGQRTEAIRLYDTLRKVLSAELGVEPLPETSALHSSILTGKYHAADAPEKSLPRRPRRQAVMGDAPQAPLVGRTAECTVLDDVYKKAKTGHLETVLLTGEMGIGKSRLWQEWSANLPAVTSVLEARCLEATQALPFAPLIETFASGICIQQLRNGMPGLSPVWLAELARVIPAIQSVAPNLPTPALLPIEEERRRLFEAFVQLTLAMRDHPLIFFIDDLHWIDSTTLDWLGFLVNRIRDQAVMLVLAYRRNEAPANLIRLMAGWAREHDLTKIDLPRLSDSEIASLVVALGCDAQLTQRVQSESAGNPLFAIELCRAWPSELSPVLSDLLRVRIDRLSATDRQVLQAACILEPEFDFPTLRRASGRGEEETLDALDDLTNASILAERSGVYAFTQPLMVKVVREGISSARKVFLHRRAAEAIIASHAGHLAPYATRLTHHYEEAKEPARAAHFAEMAAQHALTLAAPVEAIMHYRQAYALEPTPERKIHLGMALWRASHFNEARTVITEALQQSIELGNLHDAAQACLQLANLSLVSGRFDETVRWATEAGRYLDSDMDPRLQVQMEFILGAGMLQGGGSLAQAEEHLRRATTLAAEHELVEVTGQSQFELGNLLAQRGDLPHALDAYREAIQIARQTNDNFQEALAHNNYAYHALLMGHLTEAHEHVTAGLALCEAHALDLPRQYLYSTRGEIALAEEKWAEADTWFQRGIAEAEKTGNQVQIANYRANMGLAAQGRGDLDDALDLFGSAEQILAWVPAPYLQILVDLWLTALHMQRYEPVAAEQSLRRAEDRIHGSDFQRLRILGEQLRRQLETG
jgi:DNA-binding SARP family transcriptional activator/tetratricopeptide (TPR) repeat protein